MSKEKKGKQISKHEARYQHSFIKKKVEQAESLENDGISIPMGKKRKT